MAVAVWLCARVCGTDDPRVRPWYGDAKSPSTAGYNGKPFQFVGTVGTVVIGQTYTTPVYNGAASSPSMVGVIWAGVNTQQDCSDACQVNSYGVRGALGGVKAAAKAVSTFKNLTSLAAISKAGQAMYKVYMSSRSGVNSPSLSYGSASDGTYIEVVSCASYGSRDLGCAFTRGAQPLLFAVVSPKVFGNQYFHYYSIGAGGDGIPQSPSTAALYVDPTGFKYDPRSRPWYSVGAAGGGVGEPFAVVGITGSQTSRSFSTPVWGGTPTAPSLLGVMTASVRRAGESGCTDSCKSTGDAPRLSVAAGKFVAMNRTAFESVWTWQQLKANVNGFVAAYFNNRAGSSSFGLGWGGEDGSYIEVLSCLECKCVVVVVVVGAVVGRCLACEIDGVASWLASCCQMACLTLAATWLLLAPPTLWLWCRLECTTTPTSATLRLLVARWRRLRSGLTRLPPVSGAVFWGLCATLLLLLLLVACGSKWLVWLHV